MVRVNIINQNRKKPIDKAAILKAAKFTVTHIKPLCNVHINLVYVSDTEIKKLNKKFKKRDVATDVLCFTYNDTLPWEKIKTFLNADIYISSDRAKAQAKVFKTLPEEELFLYTVHGILHMLGYKDYTKQEFEAMKKKQEEILNKFLGKK